MILYKGTFVYRSGIEREYAYAKSEAEAKSKMLFRLAKKHEVSLSAVYSLFRGKPDTYRIEVEKNLKQAE
jgi:hypothetical protein